MSAVALDCCTRPADPAVLRGLRADPQTYSGDPFVIRWSPHLGELEDGRQFCIGCGRLLDAGTEDGRRRWRPAAEDGGETKRATAGQRAWMERAPSTPVPAQGVGR